MPKSVRPWLTAAVAIVGVGAVTVAPLEPAAKSEVRVENAAVLVDEAPSPFEYYPQVLQRSASHADDLVREYLADPLPIVRAIADNQTRALADVVDAAAALDPGAFVRAVVAAVSQPVAGLVKVVGSGEPFETASSMLVRLALPLVSGVLAAGAAMTDVVKAFADLDLVNAVSGLLNVPGRIADGLLNGRVDGQHDEYFGLLGKVVEAPVSEQISGPVDYLIHSLQGIGDTISSSAPASPRPVAGPAVVPDLGSPTVTVTAPADDPEPAAPPAATDDDRPAAPASGGHHADEDQPAASDDANASAPSTSGAGGEAASGASADDQAAGVERSEGSAGASTSSAAPSARGDDSDAAPSA
ncbi:hypothetical protein [Mycolicibacterium chlorophenolicum]|uniref:Uncharacterized protein n=1 Tax=Mycolicibacterium chlorophenolicum TaxID=37916 RepID=A0A0J6VN68_9MYCO|nr:hypothetical protein [Mycolicibacterium chlorophenolicum]KMO70962.1 hypothetical protein MCHLDSM_05856 [Mycolicibacterium chlorophenolicum]